MEAFIFTAGIAAILIANALVCNALGWLLTEFKGPVIKVKPFNCRPCLTFWLTTLVGAALAFVLAPYLPGVELEAVRMFDTYVLAGVSVLTGIINFLYINSKIKIYE